MSRQQNQYGGHFVEWSPPLAEAAVQAMRQTAYLIDPCRAQVILSAIRETCEFRKWHLHAMHVRTNHVHVVVDSHARPERVLNDLKAYASRRLNSRGLDAPDVKRWARHGSTRYLWDEGALASAIRYVVDEQGEPMAVYLYHRPAGSPP